MAEAIQLTMSEAEARQVLSAIKGSISMMGRDSRHDDDVTRLECVKIQLEARLQIAAKSRR